MDRTIRHSYFYPHPVETVWEFLTNSELLAQWLMKNDFKPIVGHKFSFHAAPRIKIGFDGNVYCEVLELVPNKKLSYSWRGGPGKGKITLDSVVTWTLRPVDGGTELRLEHSGFRGLRNFVPYLVMGKGWQRILKRISTRMNERGAYATAG